MKALFILITIALSTSAFADDIKDLQENIGFMMMHIEPGTYQGSTPDTFSQPCTMVISVNPDSPIYTVSIKNDNLIGVHYPTRYVVFTNGDRSIRRYSDERNAHFFASDKTSSNDFTKVLKFERASEDELDISFRRDRLNGGSPISAACRIKLNQKNLERVNRAF